MPFTEAFIALVPDADAQRDRTVLETDLYRLHVVLVPDEAEAADVSRGLVRDGVESIALCPGFTNGGVAGIAEAVGDTIAGVGGQRRRSEHRAGQARSGAGRLVLIGPRPGSTHPASASRRKSRIAAM